MTIQHLHMTGISTLQEGLSELRMTDLQDIRKKLRLKNVSTLKKAELVQHLSRTIPPMLKDILSEYDERRLSIIKRILANEGTISTEWLELEEIEYYQKHCFIFTAMYDEQPTMTIPLELLPLLKELVEDDTVLASVKRNTEWIKIVHGLLYYYGVMPHLDLMGLVEKYKPIDQEFFSVLFDAMEYYQAFTLNKYGYCHWEVMEPSFILEEQQSRPSVAYYPFTKKQLLEAGEQNFCERPKGYNQLMKLLRQEHGYSRESAEALVQDCITFAKLDYPPSHIFQSIQSDLVFDNLEGVQRIMDTIVELLNHTRKWILKGYSSNELSVQERKFLKPLPSKRGEVVSLQTGHKIARNDPCPCGSGKKFKKCCTV